MKVFSILYIFLFCFTVFAQEKTKEQKQLTTTYFFIRHAEKDLSNPKDRNPELVKEGKLRAQHWAKILGDTKLDMVFSTNYKRTLQTAKPIAESQNLEILLYNPRNLFDADFKQKTKGKTSVIVGHSNTTPAFVNEVMGIEKHSSIDEKVYGKLFIITIKDDLITDVVLSIN